MYIETIGELKYQMNIINGLCIEKIEIFGNQTDLIKRLEEIKENFKSEEAFLNWAKENIKLSCFCRLKIEVK